jgi:hypothetical protein
MRDSTMPTSKPEYLAPGTLVHTWTLLVANEDATALHRVGSMYEDQGSRRLSIGA